MKGITYFMNSLLLLYSGSNFLGPIFTCLLLPCSNIFFLSETLIVDINYGRSIGFIEKYIHIL